jgi:hypothetical protein
MCNCNFVQQSLCNVKSKTVERNVTLQLHIRILNHNFFSSPQHFKEKEMLLRNNITALPQLVAEGRTKKFKLTIRELNLSLSCGRRISL